MNYLVDTHCLIWSLIEPGRLSQKHRTLLLEPASTKLVSKVSYWEISLKYSLGKLELNGVTPEELLKTAVDSGYETYDIAEDDLATSYQLVQSETHKDPFDRLLIWQCMRNNLTFMTVDRRILEYSKYGLKIA